MTGISKKELDIISFLEFNEKFFFARNDIKQFFRNENEMNVYLHRLKRKGRIFKLNKTKYYLIPVRAFKGYWSELPFIIIDEIFNGKNYYISGMSAAYYWELIEQIPSAVEVRCTNKQGNKKIFNFTIIFKRVRTLKGKKIVRRRIKEHDFLILSKESVEKWLKSR